MFYRIVLAYVLVGCVGCVLWDTCCVSVLDHRREDESRVDIKRPSLCCVTLWFALWGTASGYLVFSVIHKRETQLDRQAVHIYLRSYLDALSKLIVDGALCLSLVACRCSSVVLQQRGGGAGSAWLPSHHRRLH